MYHLTETSRIILMKLDQKLWEKKIVVCYEDNDGVVIVDDNDNDDDDHDDHGGDHDHDEDHDNNDACDDDDDDDDDEDDGWDGMDDDDKAYTDNISMIGRMSVTEIMSVIIQ